MPIPDYQTIMLPSGQQTVFQNRVSWARTYLKKARLVESPKRGTVRITDRGMQILKSNPERVDADFLDQFPESAAIACQ